MDQKVLTCPNHTGTDWIKAAEVATGGRPRILYRASVNCAKFMAFNSPDSTLAHKFLARCDKIESEFKRMLLSRMSEDVQRSQPAPAVADPVALQIADRKRIAEVELMELEIAERRAKHPIEIAERTVKLYEAMKASMGRLDDRDTIYFKDAIRNLAVTVNTPQTMHQLRIEPVADIADTDVQVAAAAISGSGGSIRTTAQLPREWPLSAWLPEHGYGRPTLERVQILGRFVVAAYRRHNNGASPPQRESRVDGAVRLVYHYTDADEAIIEEGIADMKRAGKW
jgi:hypothetical protein